MKPVDSHSTAGLNKIAEANKAADQAMLNERVAQGALAEQLKANPNTAYFWSENSNGVGGASRATEIAHSHGGTTLEMLVDEKGVGLPVWDPTDPVTTAAWDAASRAYATQVSGTVRAVIGSDLREGAIWTTTELPALRANPNITQIIIIDPATLAETIIFQR